MTVAAWKQDVNEADCDPKPNVKVEVWHGVRLIWNRVCQLSLITFDS